MALHIEIPEVSENSTRKREGPITKKCLEWVNTLPLTGCYKRKAGPGRKGEPDISGASHGFRIEIEMKAPGNTPTPKQLERIIFWDNIGCIAGWCDCLEEFKTMIRQGLAKREIHLADRFF